MSPFVLFTILLLVSANEPEDPQENDRDDQKGIILNFQRKILIAERYINAQFVLPYPALNASIKTYLDKVSSRLDDFWNIDTTLCPLNYTNLNKTSLTIEWTLKQARAELQFALQDLTDLKKSMAFLLPAEPEEIVPDLDRKRRISPVPFAVGAGLFGLGMGTGTGLPCAFTSILGSCGSKETSRNKQALLQTVDYVNRMQSQWRQVQDKNNERLFVLGSMLAHFRKHQEEINSIQAENNVRIMKQLEIFNLNVHQYRSCNQFFYTRTSINHDMIAMHGILSTLFTIIKSFRMALYTFQTNLFQNLGHMANGYIPMALFPKESLEQVLESIASRQLRSADRLTLAIPLNKILSYYETTLLSNVQANEVGLLFTLSIPMASDSTVLNLFHAKTIPMPTNHSHAIVWEIESEYIAVTENRVYAALLSREELEHCVGSKGYSICRNGFSLQKNKDSCLGTLLFHDEFKAIENCNVRSIPLPRKETAENLGYGRWLILSANPNFRLTERPSNSSGLRDKTIHDGCNVCILTIKCGYEIESNNIFIKSDLASCRKTGAVRMNVQLASPLDNLFRQLPALPELPNVKSFPEAQKQLVEELQIKLLSFPSAQSRSQKELDDLAKPIIFKMKKLNPHLNDRFSSFVDWKSSIALGITSFMFSQFLHFGYIYLHNRFIKVHRKFPFRLNVGDRRIKTKPLAGVSRDDYRYLQQHPEHRIHNCSIVFPISESGSIPFEHTQHLYAQPLLTQPEAPPRSFYPNIAPTVPERGEDYSNRGECTTRMI